MKAKWLKGLEVRDECSRLIPSNYEELVKVRGNF